MKEGVRYITIVISYKFFILILISLCRSTVDTLIHPILSKSELKGEGKSEEAQLLGKITVQQENGC